jgi:hypothetical protein
VPKSPSKAEGEFIEAYRRGLGARAAARLAEDEIIRDAMTAAALVDAQIATMQRAGELKSVNKSYRDYRLQASARGERILPYAAWLRRYKAALVGDIAANLR